MREICWANQSPSKVGLPMDERKISFIIIIIIIIIDNKANYKILFTINFT